MVFLKYEAFFTFSIEVKMKDFFRIFLIPLLSLAIFSCAKKDDSSSSSGSSIQLSDVNANLSGKSLFITTVDSSSSSSRFSRSLNKTSSTTDSLVVQDNNSNFDYGIISEYDLEIEQVLADPSNTYSYILMKYNGGDSGLSDKNIRALNCSIFRVNLENNEMTCVEKGIVVLGMDDKVINPLDTKKMLDGDWNDLVIFPRFGLEHRVPLDTFIDMYHKTIDRIKDGKL